MDNDARISALLATIEKQRKALGTKPRAAWLTSAIFKYSSSDHFNLNVVSNPEVLVDALSFLLAKEDTRTDAAKRLGVPPSSLVWEGYPIADYEADFKHRLAIIEWDAKKKLLEQTEKKLKSLVSEEARTGMALDDIESLLKD